MLIKDTKAVYGMQIWAVNKKMTIDISLLSVSYNKDEILLNFFLQVWVLSVYLHPANEERRLLN